MTNYEYNPKLIQVRCTTCRARLFDVKVGGVFCIEIKCHRCSSVIKVSGDSDNVVKVTKSV